MTQPVVCECDRQLDTERGDEASVVPGRVWRRSVRSRRRLVNVKVDHVVGAATRPAAAAIRSATSRLASASSTPGTGAAFVSTAVTKRASCRSKQIVVLSPGGG